MGFQWEFCVTITQMDFLFKSEIQPLYHGNQAPRVKDLQRCSNRPCGVAKKFGSRQEALPQTFNVLVRFFACSLLTPVM